MSMYEELGVRRVINGNATLTAWGGSIMPGEVVQAMAAAADSFVEMEILQRRVGEEIARLTGNDAAYVTNGCAAALAIATAACIVGQDPEKRARLPFTEGLKREVIVHRHTRVPYDFCVRQVGVTLVEIGSPDGTEPAELEQAINDRTAAMFYFPNSSRDGGSLPMKQAVEICHRRGVPVVVDGAAQIPPKENLRKWTVENGADLALFSGGKGLRGPQSAGLALGAKDLIEAMRFNGPPNQFLGRPMKAGKEEMCGMLAAVRWYLAQDEEAMMRRYEEQVRCLVDAFADHPGITASRAFPSEAGQPMPRAELVLDESMLGVTRDAVRRELFEGDPAILVADSGAHGVFVNPQTLYADEEKIIARRLKEILASRRS